MISQNVKIILASLTLTLALVGPVMGKDSSDPSVKEEIQALKQMVLELQQRIHQLEAAQSESAAKLKATVEPARNKAPRQMGAKTAEKPLKRVSNPSSGVTVDVSKTESVSGRSIPEEIGANAPKPLEIAGRKVRAGISGAIQLDAIHDFNAVGLSPGDGVPREFITAEIPVGGPAADVTGRTALSPNQSYLSGFAETDTPWGPLRVYAMVNLMGSTTAQQLQLYKAYANWGWLKAGRDYTVLLNQTSIPSTLDFEGPNAAIENLFTQASLKIPLTPGASKKEFFVTVGVEDVAGDITLPTGVPNISTANQFPSLIGKLSYEPGWANMELGGLYRRLKAEGTGYDQNVNGWGVVFDGSIDTWENDSFVWGVIYGKAIGAYMQDTSGLGLDAAPVSQSDNSLKGIKAFGVWAGYQHWWTRSLRSSATYGYVHLDSDFDVFPEPAGTGTYKKTLYASLNLVWSPWPPFDVGLEYLYGRRSVTEQTAVDGSTSGHNHRLQFTMRWNFDWER